MLVRKLTSLTLLLAAAGFAGCSGGSPKNAAALTCADAGAFCLVSCNLGCTVTGGCAITDIAQNQPLVFTFSQDVDPRTVDFTSFSIKTSNGLEPVGEFVVNGATITFVPEVRTVQGQTFYGFDSGAEYVLSLTGGAGAPRAILSTGGDRLAEDYRCDLRVTLGVVDLDQRPPTARLVTPPVTTSVNRDTPIVLEFSELIDGTAFFGVSGDAAPIIYRVGRPTGTGSTQSCDATIVLGGVPRLENDAVRNVTIVTYRPPASLPAESCVQVEVTSRVRDLARTRGVRQTFEFFVESGTIQERVLEFDFENDLQLDRDASGGDWGNGEGVFAALGGDGRHGSFRLQDGSRVNDQFFVWNTDSQLLTRKDDSFLNEEVTVTDGRFYFSEFRLAQGQTIEFQGSNPVQIFVRGECRIDGTILGNGKLRTGGHNGRNSTLNGTLVVPGQGQPGSNGGPGGGRGGDGAWGCDGAGNPGSPTNVSQYNSFHGYDGEDLNVPAGHTYFAQRLGTGGEGSPLFPTHGDQSQVVFGGLSSNYAIEAASGGGGGGYVAAGAAGTVPEAGATVGIQPFPNVDPRYRGPNGPGGALFPLLQFPASLVSSTYFLIGGAGGGGGGSQPVFALRTSPTDQIRYRSGGGGAGGGGAFMFRVGADLEVGTAGRINASGGSCDPAGSTATISQLGVPAPGGGGSGGSVLLQAARGVTQQGTIDVRGGTGSRNDFSGFFFVRQFGGDGSPGFVRLERAGTAPALGELGTTLPAATAASVAQLAETDTLSGFQSLFTSTGEVFPPIYTHYEIDAVVDGQPVTFSDDPAIAPQAAISGAPLNLWVQGLQVDPLSGLPDPNDRPTPWTRYVGDFGGPTDPGLTGGNAKNGVRFLLLIDRAQAQQVVVNSVRIYYRS